MKEYRDLFKKEIPKFIAAWNNVLENGFFWSLNIALQSSNDSNNSVSLNIRAMARIPSEDKYMFEGISPYADVNDVELLLNGFKHHFEEGEFKLTSFSCDVKSEDWPLYDEEGAKITGSRGEQLEMNLFIYLERKT